MNQDNIDHNPDNLPDLPKHKGITLEDIIHCVVVKKLSYKETAKMLDCSASNVKQWVKRYDIKPGYLDKYKETRADILAYHQGEILKGLTPDKIKSARLTEISTAYGTLYDKERLERDLSTANVVSIVADLEAVRKAHNNV